jgi:hypothetical protein
VDESSDLRIEWCEAVTLIRNGDIEREEALVCAIHPDDLDILLKATG